MNQTVKAIIGSADAQELAAIVDLCATAAHVLGCEEAEDDLMSASEWLEEFDGSGVSDLADFLAQDHRQRLKDAA